MKKETKQKEFLDAMRKVYGNVSIACKHCGISRTTYYIWLKDEEFAKECEDIKELRKDFIESALNKRIAAGDTTAIIFAAKTQCKDRGYVERTEQQMRIDLEQPMFGNNE